MTTFVELLGRLHPVAVHLPIGIFILLAAVELAGWWRREARLTPALRSFFLGAGLVGALTAALFGWLGGNAGDYEPALLDRHRWLGLTFAALAGLSFVVRARPRLYPVALVATLAVLGVAGHFGGSLTHGEGYLSPVTRRTKPATPAEALVFADIIHPILQQRCSACHGPTKHNGDLRYDTLEHLLAGGKNGPVFKPGDAAASPMIRRAYLPLDAKEHMPPKGRPQLLDDEIALLEWWIDAGAPTETRVAEINPPPAIDELIAARLGAPPPRPPDRAAMLTAAEALEREKLGIVIRPLAADGPWLAASARLRFGEFGDAQLGALAPVAPALQRLDLGQTAVTDAGLAALAAMKNLRRLELNRTAITDAGLARLGPLTKLEHLNLHTTRITDAGLLPLRQLPRLRSLYLWRTAVTSAAVDELAARQTDQRKIRRWRLEVVQLEADIRTEQFTANLGESLAKTPSPPEPLPPVKPAPRPTQGP